MQKYLKNGLYAVTLSFILSGCCVIDESLPPEFSPCCRCAVWENQTPDVQITPIEIITPMPTPKPTPTSHTIPQKYAVLISAYEVNNQDDNGDGIRDGEDAIITLHSGTILFRNIKC